MAGQTWVFHRGALGDSVLIWPMLRAMRERGLRVVLVAESAKARLAAAELGVIAEDDERRRFGGLWAEGAAPEPVAGVQRVVSFVADDRTPAGRIWLRNAQAMFPGAAIDCIPAPVDRPAALRLAGGRGVAPVRSNPGGPAVLHTGAGSSAKRWPMMRWAGLAAALRSAGEVQLIAGEVELERFAPEDRTEFQSAGGRFIGALDDLAGVLRSARLFVGCDSGPTHMAAQLGVPTVALFGPTDPTLWGPIGPRARVLAPPSLAPMTWLGVDRVVEAAGDSG